MSRRLVPIIVLSLFAVSMLTEGQENRRPLIVHEWGTFTSIAGDDGSAVEWLPMDGPADLPCFVKRSGFAFKANLPGTIRMETPVVYFYASQPMTVNVNVRFRQGALTEWFPRALVTPAEVTASSLRSREFTNTIRWADVNVSPGAVAAFPVEQGSSHYYKARETDASPVQLASEQERFLFYRGVGGFQPPISATVTADGNVVVRRPKGEPLGDLILFENRGGVMAYQARQAATDQIDLNPPVPDEESGPPLAELEALLVSHGLYPKEARAMVETWSDSWFGEGARLFYLVDRKAVDAIVPLEIDPIPTEMQRVFVGRIELVTPATREEVRAAINSGDSVILSKYGRFLQPIGREIVKRSSPADQSRMEARLRSIYASWARSSPVCR
jgi:hypothetical protein